MRLFITVLLLATIISDAIAPPVDKKTKAKQTLESDDDENIVSEAKASRRLMLIEFLLNYFYRLMNWNIADI